MAGQLKKTKKICMIGSEGVGKTSLVRRFVDDQFSETYLSTIGVQISQKKIDLPGGKTSEIILWDLEGYHFDHSLSDSYLTGSYGFIFVADIVRDQSLSELVEHTHMVKSKMGAGYLGLIAINKVDLIDASLVESKCSELNKAGLVPEGMPILQTSAKTGQGVSEMFQNIAYHMWSDEI